MNLFREIRSLVDGAVGFPLALLDGQKDVARFRSEQEHRSGAPLDVGDRVVHAAALHRGDQGGRRPRPLHEGHLQVSLARGIPACSHGSPGDVAGVRGHEWTPRRRWPSTTSSSSSAQWMAFSRSKLGSTWTTSRNTLTGALPTPRRTRSTRTLMRAKRYTFIESGVTHPNFLEVFGAVTTPQAAREGPEGSGVRAQRTGSELTFARRRTGSDGGSKGATDPMASRQSS